MTVQDDVQVINNQDMVKVMTLVFDTLRDAGYNDFPCACLVQVAGCLLACASDNSGIPLEHGLKAAKLVAESYQRMNLGR